MIRIIAIALLFAGSGVPVATAGQPDRQTPQAAPAQPAAPAPPLTPAAPHAPAPSSVWVGTSTSGRSYLGVDIQDVTADRVAALKLKEERGVEVTMVDQDAPAGKAGIKEHDVITEFNGATVESEEQLRRMIREIPPGRTVTLGISRDGNPMKISVQLGDRGKIMSENRKVMVAPMPRIQIPRVEMPNFTWQLDGATYSSALRAHFENPGKQLCEFFGVKDGDCVLVRSVEKGGAAEKAGLRAGDVVIRADNEKVANRGDIRRALDNHRDGGKLSLAILRDKHEQTVAIDLPKRGGSGDSWRIIDLDEGHFLLDEMNDLIDLDGLEPATRKVKEMAALQMRDEAKRFRREMERMKPEFEKTLRESQSEWLRLQKQFEKEMKMHWGTMI